MPEKWLVTGASGLLGHHVCRHLLASGANVTGVQNSHPIEATGVAIQTLDLLNRESIKSLIKKENPDYIFHTAALANVDECEKNPQKAYAFNLEIVESLAEEAAALGCKLIHVTTDQLWSGNKPYVTEDEPVNPPNIYGRTKALSESAAMKKASETLILRTNFFGHGRPWRKSFSDWLFEEFSNKRTINGFSDIYYTPIAIDFFIPYSLRLARENHTGIFHLAGAERISKLNFIKSFAAFFGFDSSLINECRSQDLNLAAPRPLDMSLCVKKAESALGLSMPNLKNSFETLISQNHERKYNV